MHTPPLAPPSAVVYLSHASKDSERAHALCSFLEERGIRCWISPRDIPPGHSYSCRITEAISSLPCFVVLASEAAINSISVHREIEQAFSLGKRIFPVYLNVVNLSPDMHFLLSGFRGTRMGFGPISGPDMEALATAIKAHAVSPDSPPPAEPIASAPTVLKQPGMLAQALPAIARIFRWPSRRHTPDCSLPPASSSASAPPLQAQLSASARAPIYDVFISYRRDRDAQTARLIRSELQKRHYKVFLDVDDLRPGHFDEALYGRIRDASSFIVILSPGSLERCNTTTDWLRKEIACALAEKKIIIPILMPEFKFPSDSVLPYEITSLQVHHGVAYSHDYFDGMLVKIFDFIGKPSGIGVS